MKRALVLTLALILGLGLVASAQLKGSWASDFTLDFKDIVLAGEIIHMPAVGPVSCVGGSVTILPYDITATVAGQNVVVTIPGGTYDVVYATPPGQTASVTIPDQDVTVHVAAMDVVVHVPGGTYACTGGTVTLPAYDIVVSGHTITNVPTWGFKSVLIVNYTVGGWVFGSKSTFAMTGWTGQEFSVNGTLGAFTIGSLLVFNPALASFTSWKTTGSVSIAGVTFSGMWLLGDAAAGVPFGSGFTLGAAGASGPLTAAATVYFNISPATGKLLADTFCICWNGIVFTIHFPFCCVQDVAMTVSFSTAGFDYVSFGVIGIPVPGISWLTLDALVTFSPGVGFGKVLTLTPQVNFAAGCFTLYSHITTAGGTWPGTGDTAGDLVITGLSIDGIALKCTIGAVKFEDYSSISPAYNATITGDALYWEKFCISSAADSCCGGAFSFSVCMYFSETSLQLFDLGKTVVNLSYGIGSNLTVRTSLTVLSIGLTQWTFGFTVTW